MRLYREFISQEEIDAEYRTDVGIDLAQLLKHYAALGDAARASFRPMLGLRYGPTKAERLDLFPSGPDSPVFIFIHGGYWRLGAARDVHMLANGLVPNGVAVALVDYALCPSVSIDEITRQVRAAVAWVGHEAKSYGIDPRRIFVAGHSAGGQQVGMLLATDWEGEYELAPDLLKGALAISGIFDLRPLRYSWLQPRIQLTAEIVERQSPLFHIPRSGPPLLLTCGGAESKEFHRQSHDYLHGWRANGLPGRFIDQPGANHFTALESLAQPDGLLARAVLELIDQV